MLCIYLFIIINSVYGKYIEWNFKDKIIYVSNDAWNNNNNNCDKFKIYSRGNAKVTENGLECNGYSAYTPFGFNKTFNEKSLEVYVYRTGNMSHNSAAISIDSSYTIWNYYNGGMNKTYSDNSSLHEYDSIAYSTDGFINEYVMASDYNRRTIYNNNNDTLNDINIYEHLVAVYNNDNSINLYYNGQLYRNYTKGNLTTFNAEIYRILFCKRHGQVHVRDYPYVMPFDGIIIKGAIYDYSLTSNEVLSLYNNRDISNGDNECNMLLNELTTLDICDDIHLSFNIKIDRAITDSWVFAIGSDPTLSLCLYNVFLY